MATKGGTITRKDLITDEGLRWGPEYAENINTAITANEKLVSSAKELLVIVNAYRKVNSQNAFLEEKQKETLATIKAKNAIKEEEAALISMEKIKRESIATAEAERKAKQAVTDAEIKGQKAKQATVKLSLDEKVINEANNKILKQEARERQGLVGTYEKLNRARLESQKRLAELLSAEQKNTKEITKASIEFEKLDARVKAVDAATRNYSKNIGNYSSAFSGLNETAKSLLSTFGVLTGLALFGAVVKDIFNVVKDFDRQLIAVGKTTNITGEDLKQFGREVVELADNLDGITVDGLIQSAEVAGQLGVTGTANILKFSEAIEKLKLTSNIISEEQVGQFAKFIEVSSDSFENADKLASVITQLGNSFATTESEVLANATEIQKGIAVYKTSAQGVLALGAATSTLGSEAESSRSAIQTTFGVINTAIATGKNLEKILKLTGLTQKELSKQFNQDATGVFVKFVEGLSKAKSEGGNLATILNDVEISEKRAFTVVGSLAANYGILESSIAQANLEYIQNTALNKEVEAASQSIASIVADLRDKWEVYVLQMNDANSGTQALTKTLKFLRDNFKEIIDFTIKAGAVLLTYLGIQKAYNFFSNQAVLITEAYALAKSVLSKKTLENAGAEAIDTAAKRVQTSATIVQTEATVAATTATKGFSLALASTGIGDFIALLGAAVTAYLLLRDGTDDYTDAVLRNKKAKDNAVKKAKTDTEELYKEEKKLFLQISIKQADLAKYEELRKTSSDNELKRIDSLIQKTKEEIGVLKDKLEIENTQVKTKKEASFKSTVNEALELEKESKKLELDNINLKERLKKLTSVPNDEEGRKNLVKNLDKIKIEADFIRAEIIKNGIQISKNNIDATYFNQRIKELRPSKSKEDTSGSDAGFVPTATPEEIRARAKKLSDSAFEVKKQELERTIKINDEVAKNQEENDDLRLEAIKVRSKAETDLIDLTKQHALDADKFVTAENKLNADQKLVIARDAAFKIEDVEKKKAEEIKKINEFDPKEYELELKRSTDFLNIGTQNALAEEEKRFQAELALGYANDKAKEDAAEEHEKKLFDIKKAGLIAQTRLQINTLNDELNAYEAQADGSQKSQDYILAQRAKVAELSARLIQTEGETFKANEEDKGLSAKEQTEKLIQISEETAYQLADLSNTFSEREIQKIDDKIEKNNEYYDKQIELAGNDERQKDLLNKEREKKNEELEKKKREAQRKQAIFNKGFALAEIAYNTTKAVMAVASTGGGTYYADFGVSASLLTALTIALGAAQAATVLATPIPKYKDGRKGGKSEIAWVGDGGVSEVISGPKGIDPRVTPNTPTLTHLKQGDIVHKSMADYQAYMRPFILYNFRMQGQKMNQFQAMQNEEKYGKEMLDELKRNTRAIEKQKHGTVVNLPKLDINHHLWKQRNTNWN